MKKGKVVEEGFVIPLIYDTAIKGVMKSNKDFFKIFAAKLLNIPYEAIESGEFVDNELVTEHNDDTHHRVDIIFKSDDTLINMEANTYSEGIEIRNNRYIYRIILNEELLKSGEEKEIKDYYQINIDKVNFDFNKKLINRFETREIENGIKLPYTPIIVNVALAYLKKEEYTKNIDKWLLNAIRLFTANSENAYKKYAGNDKTLSEVAKFMINYSKDPKVINEYFRELDEKFAKDYDIRQATKKGEQKGFQKGERNKALETAKKMLNDNENIDKIMKYTDLTKEEIENLK